MKKRRILNKLPVLIIIIISGYTLSAEERSRNPHRTMILDLSERNKTGDTELVALKHCFDIFSIKYIITENVSAASGSPVIFTAGDLRNTTFTPAELEELYAYVENGGVLVSQVITGNKLFPLFGITGLSESKRRYRINFVAPSADPSLRYIGRPEERKVLLGNKKLYSKIIWTHSFSVKDAVPLAFTGDKKAIFSVNRYGEGLAYALGVSLSDTVLLTHVGNDYEAQRGWINTFEPGSDVFMLLMKAVYEKYTAPVIYLGTAPFGKKTALILSHDVDAQASFKNMVDYANLEKRFSTSATYFITTKYFKDSQDKAYYNDKSLKYIKQIKKLGADIGSHTVSHSIIFEKFPTGGKNTARKNYRVIKNPTVFGEVKVSKELLDSDIPGQNTVSFRAGYLRYPDNLIDVLEKSGYRFDSSFSANDIMCNYAFRAFRYRKVGAEETSIVEIPVIFDDSRGLLTRKNADELVDRWVDIIKANGDNEAISVLLIHTSEAGYKLRAQEKLLSRTSGNDIWIGNLSDYGEFWAARYNYSFESRVEGDRLTIKILNGKTDERLCFCIKNIDGIKNIRLLGSDNKAVRYTRTIDGDKLTLHPVSR